MGEDALARFRREHMGVVFQSFHLIPTMTAIENVATPLELAGARGRLRAGGGRAGGDGARRRGATTTRRSSRAASSSGWRWPARRWRGRRSCWPTSRPATSTAPRGRRSSSCSSGCATGTGRRWCWSRTRPEIATRCDRVLRLRDGRPRRASGAQPPCAARGRHQYRDCESAALADPRREAASRLARAAPRLRELRGGLAGFRVFLACLALGVAAIAAVGSVRAAIGHGLAREAAALLGGDAEIEFTYRFADPDERAWMDGERHRGLRDRRLPLAARGPPARRRARAHAGAGQGGGRPLSADRGGGAGRRRQPRRGAGRRRAGCPGLVAERVLVDRLGLAPGAVVRLGTQDFRLAGTLALGARRLAARREPSARASSSGGRSWRRAGFSPRASMFDCSYRLRLAARGRPRRAAQARPRPASATPACSGATAASGPPGIGRFLDRLGAFLVLVGLAGLAVGGIGVAAAVRAHLEAKTAHHRHAEDPRRHRRHHLRRLPDRDRPSGAARHRPRPRRSAPALPLVAAPLPRRAPAGARRVRPLPAPAGRGGALRPAHGAPLHALAAGARPRHPRRRAFPRPHRRPPRLAAPRLSPRHGRRSPRCWSRPRRSSPARPGWRSAPPAGWPARWPRSSPPPRPAPSRPPPGARAG